MSRALLIAFLVTAALGTSGPTAAAATDSAQAKVRSALRQAGFDVCAARNVQPVEPARESVKLVVDDKCYVEAGPHMSQAELYDYYSETGRAFITVDRFSTDVAVRRMFKIRYFPAPDDSVYRIGNCVVTVLTLGSGAPFEPRIRKALGRIEGAKTVVHA